MKLNAWKVKLLLAEQEMNQSDLAERSGLTRQQIGEILSSSTLFLTDYSHEFNSTALLCCRQYSSRKIFG